MTVDANRESTERYERSPRQESWDTEAARARPNNDEQKSGDSFRVTGWPPKHDTNLFCWGIAVWKLERGGMQWQYKADINTHTHTHTHTTMC